jgi:hypothetical protein
MNDDEYAATLLAPLAGDPPDPGRVDVARAMRDGLKRRRRLRWPGLTGLVAAVSAVITGSLLLAPGQQNRPQPVLPPDPTLPASCTAAVLPMGHWPSAEVDGGDPTGRWQVGISEPTAGGDNRTLLWHDGKLVAEAPKQYAGIWMTDINSAGVAVGWRQSGNGIPYAYRDGRFIQLKGGGGRAEAINDSGVVAGLIEVKGKGERPARWSYPGAEPEMLAVPPVRTVVYSVVGIEPDGTVVGTVGRDAYEWLPDGTARRLPPPSVPGASLVETSAEVVRFGWIYAMVANNSPRPSLNENDLGYSDLYRFEPRSGTWQHVARDGLGPQLVGNGIYARFMQDDPSVLIGTKSLKLSARPPSVPAKGVGYEIRAVSADARVFAGNASSNRADPSVPSLPVIWRCR